MIGDEDVLYSLGLHEMTEPHVAPPDSLAPDGLHGLPAAAPSGQAHSMEPGHLLDADAAHAMPDLGAFEGRQAYGGHVVASLMGGITGGQLGGSRGPREGARSLGEAERQRHAGGGLVGGGVHAYAAQAAGHEQMHGGCLCMHSPPCVS